MSDVKKIGFGLMEGVIWEELSEKRRSLIEDKTKKVAQRYRKPKVVAQNLKVKLYFTISKMLHKRTLKDENTPSADNQYWIDQGWIKYRG